MVIHTKTIQRVMDSEQALCVCAGRVEGNNLLLAVRFLSPC